jgi:signal transduction histidine kinase/DNA-binding response OmpR family regulator
MEPVLKILFIEDVIEDAELIWLELKKRNISFSKVLVDNQENYLESIEKFGPDLIISDYSLPEFDGLTALHLRNDIVPLTPFIIVTGSVNEEVAVECIKAGADDYVLKERLSRLGPAVMNSLTKAKLLRSKKAMEEELRESYAFSDSLLRTIPFGMDIVDEQGTIVFQSENLKNISGVDAVGKKCWETYRDDKTQCPDCPLTSGIIIGNTRTCESRGVLGDRIFEISHTGMMYKDNKVMLEIFQDITIRKKNEAELVMAREKAEESDKLKTAFLHNISHEIRTPMNAIIGFSTLLSEHHSDYHARQSYIDIIIQSSNQLLGIITDIIDISNIEANLFRISKTEINLNSKLRTFYDQILPKAEEKDLQLFFESALSSNESTILIDSTKLFQILTNLINNALKFTRRGQIKLEYKVRNDFLEFSVADTGIGIAKEFHKKIFERFYQVQSTVSRIYEGTGLGLSISKAYVERMGGKIWLESEPGKGSVFYFTIPFEKVSSINDSILTKKMTEGRLSSGKKTILIAEDTESNFKLIKYFLSDSNIEILRAVNGKEAVEKCLSGRLIDLVLMDIKMPVMNGYTAIKLIRETIPSIPIIAQTSYADDLEKAIESGCTGYISKPFDKKGLLRVLSEYF